MVIKLLIDCDDEIFYVLLLLLNPFNQIGNDPAYDKTIDCDFDGRDGDYYFLLFMSLVLTLSLHSNQLLPYHKLIFDLLVTVLCAAGSNRSRKPIDFTKRI